MGLLAIVRWTSAFGNTGFIALRDISIWLYPFSLPSFSQRLQRGFEENAWQCEAVNLVGTVCIDSCKVAMSVSSLDVVYKGRSLGGRVGAMRLGLTISMIIFGY